MPLLVVCFVLFFGLAELFPIVEGLTLPMPVYGVAGLLLAIASNYTKPAGLPWSIPHPPAQPIVSPTPPRAEPKLPVAAEVKPSLPPKLSPTSTKKVPELPKFNLQPRPSVSFVIRSKSNDYSTGGSASSHNPKRAVGE